jgi:DNA-binding NtrC family response regulator
MLIDDEPAVIKGLERSLRHEGYTLLAAHSAQEALVILDEQQVDVLVCDEHMPGMTGTELLTLVRQRYPDSIRIILTGQATLETAIKAINHGEIYRFLTKPCSSYELIQTIRQGLRQQRLLRQSSRLLQKYRRQKKVLRDVESRFANLSAMQREADDSIVVAEERLDLESVLREIEKEL